MRKDREATRTEALAVYARLGGRAAAEVTGVSIRTIQRWAYQHGVKSGYTAEVTRTPCPSVGAYMRGCRCEDCVRLRREEQREVKERRLAKAEKRPGLIPHGVSGYANWDCRCAKCRSEWTKYLRERRAARAASREAPGGEG